MSTHCNCPSPLCTVDNSAKLDRLGRSNVSTQNEYQPLSLSVFKRRRDATPGTDHPRSASGRTWLVSPF